MATPWALRYWLIGCGALLALLTIAPLLLVPSFERLARREIIKALAQRYQSDVEISSFHAGLFPTPHATAEGLKLRFHRRTDVPPIAEIQRITAEGSLFGIFGERPIHIHKVTLEGLMISVPPRNRDELHEKPLKNPQANFVINEVVADGTTLRMIPALATKDPLRFEIRELRLYSSAVNQPVMFTATLVNPKPHGLVHTSGQFGPWNSEDPGLSPLQGKYTFRDADLATFNGIAGTLSSNGVYHGQLSHIECSGTTDTPDFSVSVGGRPVDLKTQFHALVDGMNGNTTLDPVTATFLHSSVVARGTVMNVPERKGKRISLDVMVKNGRIEDFLRLVAKGERPMIVGASTIHASFELLPGTQQVIDRLTLKGTFDIARGSFTDPDVQAKINGMSRRASGDPKGEIERVGTEFVGNLVLRNAIASFSNLTFAIPGARVDLQGSFGLRSQAIDFHGTVATQAKVSQMTTGIASFLLRAIDPLFKRNGSGALFPISITGTRAHPVFGLEFRFKK